MSSGRKWLLFVYSTAALEYALRRYYANPGRIFSVKATHTGQTCVVEDVMIL